MRKNNNLTLITAEELEKINHEIIPLFGVRNRVTSGSKNTFRGRITQCHIGIGDTVNTYKSLQMLKKIGEKVKEVMGAGEVYSFGIKLA